MAPKPKVLRVKGLRFASEREAQNALDKYLQEKIGEEEKNVSASASIVPSSDPDEHNEFEALVTFAIGEYPRFLLNGQKDVPETFVTSDKVNNRALRFDKSFHGFTQLFPTRPATSAVADIIAVTGLDGHAYGSWASEEGMWLRYALEDDMPRARVMIYGYNTKLAGGAGGTLETYAKRLLEELEIVRSSADAQRRPLFFIAHSLGGLIVMRALVKAKAAQGSTDLLMAARSSLYKATYGFMFMGVPQGGMDLHDLAHQMELDDHPLLPLIRDISKHSSLRKTLSSDFKNLIGHRKVVSFVEGNTQKALQKNPSNGMWERSGRPRQSLGREDSVLNLPDSIENDIHCPDKDHSTIAKLSQHDPEYKRVKKILQQWERDATIEVMNQFSKPDFVPIPSHNIPFARDTNFVGREECIEAIDRAFQYGSLHVRVGLWGISGIGKSQIAIEYAHRCRARAQDIWVFWVRAGDRPSIEKSFIEISKLQTGKELQQGENVFAKVAEWLKNRRNGCWLMVLDNLDDWKIFFEKEQITSTQGGEVRSHGDPLIHFIPQVEHGKILVTSRDRRSAFRVVNNNRNMIKVNTMTAAESIELLRSRIPDIVKTYGTSPLITESDVMPLVMEKELVEFLNLVPLAISQAGAYMAQTETSPTEYLRECGGSWDTNDSGLERAMLEDEGDLRREDQASELLRKEEEEKKHAVMHTWRVTFRRLEQTHPKSADLLSLMVFYHSKGIPQYLLQDDRNGCSFKDALKPLLTFDLVQITSNNTIAMHRLVQVATRNYLSFKNNIETFRFDALKRMVKHLPPGSYNNWSKFQELHSHAEEVCITRNRSENHAGKELHGMLLDRMAIYFHSKGELAWAARMIVGALEQKQKVLDEEDWEILQTKILKVAIFGEGGNWRLASTILEEVRTSIISHATDPKYLAMLPTVLKELSNTCMHNEFFDQAERFAQMAYQVCSKCYGLGSPETMSAMKTLATAYKSVSKLKEAERIWLQLRESYSTQPVLNEDSRVSTLVSLAGTYFDMERNAEAESLYLEALQAFSHYLSERHGRVLSCLSSYRSLLLRMKRFDDAEVKCNEIEERLGNRWVENHNLKLSNKLAFAEVREHQKRWQEAENLIKEVISIGEEYADPWSLYTFSAQDRLAVLYNNKGDYKQAEKLSRKLMQKSAALVHPTHKTVLLAKQNLAISVMNQGRFIEAIKIQKDVEISSQQSVGSKHERTRAARELWIKWEDAYNSIPIFGFKHEYEWVSKARKHWNEWENAHKRNLIFSFGTWGKKY